MATPIHFCLFSDQNSTISVDSLTKHISIRAEVLWLVSQLDFVYLRGDAVVAAVMQLFSGLRMVEEVFGSVQTSGFVLKEVVEVYLVSAFLKAVKIFLLMVVAVGVWS